MAPPTVLNLCNFTAALHLARACRAAYYDNLLSDDSTLSVTIKKVIRPGDSDSPYRAIVGSYGKDVVVVFRGSVIATPSDPLDKWKEMLLCMLGNVLPVLKSAANLSGSGRDETSIDNNYGCHVHYGFAFGLEELWDEFKYELDARASHEKVILAGHSLGGALATLAAYRLSVTTAKHARNVEVYTFGSPSSGDHVFASKYRATHYRFENQSDIIPYLPPRNELREALDALFHDLGLQNVAMSNIDYTHVGTLVFFHRDGSILQELQELQTERSIRNMGLSLSIFSDHSIDSYITQLERLSQNTQRSKTGASVSYGKPHSYQRKESGAMKADYNIVVLGKAGVGKSTLINYLYGRKVSETGVGKPVTLKNFECFNFKFSDVSVAIYDSVGLEVGRHAEWMKDLENELDKRGADRPASDWFHTVFYCINAVSHRLESFEVSIIKMFLDNHYRVVVVLTHADLQARSKIEKLEQVIKSELPSDVSTVRVCSEEEHELPSGAKSVTFGAKEIEQECLRGFWYALSIRLPDRCEALLHAQVDRWFSDQTEYVRNSSKFSEAAQRRQHIRNACELFKQDLEQRRLRIISEEVRNTVALFQDLAEKLRYPSPEDLPDLRKVKLFRNDFIQLLQNMLLELGNSAATFFANLLAYVADRPKLNVELNIACRNLKEEISRQKPQIQKAVQILLETRQEKLDGF